MSTLKNLLENVSAAGKQYLDQVKDYDDAQGQWKPSPLVWSISENTEHLLGRARRHSWYVENHSLPFRKAKCHAAFESIHRDMPVEEIVQPRKDKERRGATVAAPRLGGPLSFWSHSLNSLQTV